MSGDTHMISLTGPEELVEDLVTKELAIIPDWSNEDEDADDGLLASELTWPDEEEWDEDDDEGEEVVDEPFYMDPGLDLD